MTVLGFPLEDHHGEYNWPTRKEWGSLTGDEQRELAERFLELATRRRATNYPQGLLTSAQEHAIRLREIAKK